VFPADWPPQPTRFVRLHLDTTPQGRALIDGDRLLGPVDVRALGGPPVQSGGLLLDLWNRGDDPARFVANVMLVPNEGAIEQRIASHAERDWAQAYDRALRMNRNQEPKS
jgi:hypothetical protein